MTRPSPGDARPVAEEMGTTGRAWQVTGASFITVGILAAALLAPDLLTHATRPATLAAFIVGPVFSALGIALALHGRRMAAGSAPAATPVAWILATVVALAVGAAILIWYLIATWTA